MTQSQLADRLIATLVRDHGGTRQRWRKLVGPVNLYSIKTHAHCNWAIIPTGSNSEILTIEALVDELRMSHPILVADR